VFPCHTPAKTGCSCTKRAACTDTGKHPRTKNGLNDATTDEATIRRWWKMWPAANIGLRTGAVSGLVVLDVDFLKGGAESLADLEQSYHPLPQTVQQLTGNGQHYLFAHPGQPVKNGVEDFAPGLDIRADGGYIIAAPSLHATGKHYAWEVLHELDETPLAPMPAWLIALCQEQARHAAPSAGDPIPDGQRNDTLFRHGCSFRARGCTEAVILAALLEMNTTQCQPPLPDEDIRTIAASCAKYEAGAIPDVQKHRNGNTPGPAPSDPLACPELPTSAQVDEASAAEASLFLDEYIAFSTRWAPRAYGGFHEAIGLWLLSTTAAHRVKIELGPHGVYTSLYLALASRTSLYTKTTAVDIGLAFLHRAGLKYLLAADDATPQAFLRSLTLYIPPEYAELPQEAQEAVRQRLAFAGQKGWFYEEWGQHLHAMMQKEGQMASFRGILRRLDDHRDEHVYESIGRGKDVLLKPYVALLANVTPADLKPFMRAHDSLWRDGYIARFAFITPGKTPATSAEFPEGAMTLPDPLVKSLASWHKRLGIPLVALDPIIDAKQKMTGRYQPAFVQPHRETTYVLSPPVRKAFYAYDAAMHTLMAQSKNEDLDGSYARFPMKALRIAGLLASLHDDSTSQTIWPRHWYRGQQIAERWRQNLHSLIAQLAEDRPVSREHVQEDRIVEVLRANSPLPVRGLHLKTKLSYTDIERTLQVLVSAGAVRELRTPQTKKYAYVATEGEKV